MCFTRDSTIAFSTPRDAATAHSRASRSTPRMRRARAIDHARRALGALVNAHERRAVRSRHVFAGTNGATTRWMDVVANRAIANRAIASGGRTRSREARWTSTTTETLVCVPSMGDSITEGTVSAVMKSVGDDVATDEVVAQIETDKVTVDVRAPSAGNVARVDAKTGDTVRVGQVVMAFVPGAGGNGKKTARGGSAKTAASAPSAEPVGVEVPSMGDSITEGSVAALLVKAGQRVAMDEIIAQIETDKVTIDVRASTSGTVTEVLTKEGETVSVGQKVATLAPGPGPEARAETKAEVKAEAPAAKAAKGPKAVEAPKAAATPAPAPKAAGSRSETRVPMSRLRLRVAERLKSSQNTYAMLTTFNEIDMTNVMNMRAEYKDSFLEKHGVKLGFMSTFVSAAAKALQEEPSVNAVIDGDEIVYRNYVDISVAVSAPRGLVVPVLRNCESMTFADVEASIATYGKKAKDGTLSIDEMAGGTFTISNGGVFGSLTGTPIINPPQSAILGMHSIVWRPVCVGPERTIAARPMMNVALTYDHRLVDGREAVTFLKSIKESVEDPRRMLLKL